MRSLLRNFRNVSWEIPNAWANSFSVFAPEFIFA